MEIILNLFDYAHLIILFVIILGFLIGGLSVTKDFIMSPKKRSDMWKKIKYDISRSNKEVIFFAGVVFGFFFALFVIWIVENSDKGIDTRDLNSVPQSEYCDNYGCDIF